VLHGQTVYAHTKSSPGFWKFLRSVRGELARDFDEVVWVGSERDREVGKRLYPEWKDFDDHGSFLELAQLIAGSDLVVGVGSSVVALAGALKVPCVRVHDPIGDHAKRIWDNLAHNSINDTEVDLRKTWPTFRDEHLKAKVAQ
jgi:ADP-heptose:LPS heptosyltransferase